MSQEAKDILKKAREGKGFTQTDMANALGIGLRMYQKIEDGQFPKYKTEQVKKIDEILGCNIYALVYEQNILNEPQEAYLNVRRTQKNGHSESKDGIEFVPISAQAGYLKHINDEAVPLTFEKIYIPGFPFRGERFRYFEVAGDSMIPGLEEGFHVLAEKVDMDQWYQQADYYIYVIVTIDQIMIKRIFKKSDEQWAIISDNEEFYPQFLLATAKVKEVWKVKRKIDWRMSPPKKFDIKV